MLALAFLATTSPPATPQQIPLTHSETNGREGAQASVDSTSFG
jgi:hypothetical protein